MADTKKNQLRREVDALAREVSRLAIACDIELGHQGLPERIFRNDETVCRKRNPEAFAKLRRQLIALAQIEGKAMEDLGREEAIGTLNRALAEVARLRKLGSPNASVPRQF